jgi:hypothetical protein
MLQSRADDFRFFRNPDYSSASLGYASARVLEKLGFVREGDVAGILRGER